MESKWRLPSKVVAYLDMVVQDIICVVQIGSFAVVAFLVIFMGELKRDFCKEYGNQLATENSAFNRLNFDMENTESCVLEVCIRLLINFIIQLLFVVAAHQLVAAFETDISAHQPQKRIWFWVGVKIIVVILQVVNVFIGDDISENAYFHISFLILDLLFLSIVLRFLKDLRMAAGSEKNVTVVI